MNVQFSQLQECITVVIRSLASSQIYGLKRLNMTSYSLSNVLLPAVFISSAVFSTLTVPLALIKSEPVVVELPPFFSNEIPPIFNGEHKDVAIPYVGFSIIVSVGAGIASVEVRRRWQSYKESLETQEQFPTLQQTSSVKEAQQDSLKRPEYRPEASAIDLSTKADVLSQSLTDSSSTTESTFIAVEAPEQVIDVSQFGLPQPTELHQNKSSIAVSDNLNLPDSHHENDSAQIETHNINSQEFVHSLNLAFGKFLESRHLYKTCRIKVSHLEQRLFAILFESQYYSFLKAVENQDKVLEIIAKVGCNLQETVVTKTEKGYVIWILEPEFLAEVSS
jgi:hypothetical protein